MTDELIYKILIKFHEYNNELDKIQKYDIVIDMTDKIINKDVIDLVLNMINIHELQTKNFSIDNILCYNNIKNIKAFLNYCNIKDTTRLIYINIEEDNGCMQIKLDLDKLNKINKFNSVNTTIPTDLYGLKNKGIPKVRHD